MVTTRALVAVLLLVLLACLLLIIKPVIQSSWSIRLRPPQLLSLHGVKAMERAFDNYTNGVRITLYNILK